MKKNYVKPDAEYVAFYSDEDIASVLPIDRYKNSGDDLLEDTLSGSDNTEGWE